MPISLQLYSAASVLSVEDPFQPYLIVANRTESTLVAPNLDGRGHREILLTLIDPHGHSSTFALPDDLGHEPAAAPHADLEPGHSVMRTFSIPSTRLPGPYRLSAGFRTGEQELTSNILEWSRETASVQALVVPGYRGALNPSGQRAYFLLSGPRLRRLYACQLVCDEAAESGLLRADASEPLLDLSEPVDSLAAISGLQARPDRLQEWLLWLSGGTLHAGIEFYGFQHLSCPLPFPGARMASQIPAPDGLGCDVLLTSDDNCSLAIVRFGRPTAQPMLESAPEIIEDYPTSPALEDQDGEDEDDEPLCPVDIPAPAIVWQHRFAEPLASAALANPTASQDQERAALAVAVQRPDEVEVFFSTWASPSTPTFDSIVITDAQLLPNCPITMAVDRRGRAHIALLLTKTNPGGDRQVVLARTLFGEDGRARLDRESVLHEAAPLPPETVSGAISFFIDDSGGPWAIDWTVLLPGNRCLASDRTGPARLVSPKATILNPVSTLSFEARASIPAAEGGRPVFT